jgi:two-component system sensor histidine kinase PilS (NtrC family)
MREQRTLAWLIVSRLAVVTLFFGSIAILNAKQPDSLGSIALPGLFRLVVATYLFSIASFLVSRFFRRAHTPLSYLQIVWDVLFVTVLILLTGGAASAYSFLYNLAIINASVLLARREAFYTASLCSIVYGAIIDLQFYDKLGSLELSSTAAQQIGTNFLLFTLFTNILGFFLTALLTGYLAERARASEWALQEKVIDYEELERLNSTIVATIDSGLLTINTAGRIRVFNKYAAELTGFTQEMVYDRPLNDVIPGFTAFGESLPIMQRQEVEFVSGTGDRRIFGFKSVPFNDNEGNRVGMIIDFQDLTKLKQMERELKKADRLAAIGELSARIAHEIRNPLAAVSGSVQLISMRENIAEEDQKLLQIVIRETERLNKLVTDFLDYARPISVNRGLLSLPGCIDELFALLAKDIRFATIRLTNQCPRHLMINVDIDKFRQVLWNLLLNAAEALATGGEIVIDARLSGETGQQRSVILTVTDNGHGISPQHLALIFEPFFTTKAGGTGLGLASVYRIIEAHGGRINVESSRGKGTTFFITLTEIPSPA